MNTRPCVYPDCGEPSRGRNFRYLLANVYNTNEKRKLYIDWCGEYLYPTSEDIFESKAYKEPRMKLGRCNWRPEVL